MKLNAIDLLTSLLARNIRVTTDVNIFMGITLAKEDGRLNNLEKHVIYVLSVFLIFILI